MFAFTIDRLDQLQPTRMPQESVTTEHTMTALLQIALESISEPNPEPSLLHQGIDDIPLLSFFINDIFNTNKNFEKQFNFF